MFSLWKRLNLARHRLGVQVFALLALHSSWGPEAKWFCNPVLSCHSCALAWFACPVGVFIHFSGYRIFPFLALGMVALLGVLLGRLLCGWVCPFGFLQDLLFRIRSPKFRLPRWTHAIKYIVLLLTVVAIPFVFGEQTLYSFCRVCPASALQVTVPRIVTLGMAAISPAIVVKLAILAGVLVLCVLCTRGFCRLLCPIGAMLAPFNLFSFWRVRAPGGRCISCQACDRACPTDDMPSERLTRGIDPSRSLDCVTCHACARVCRGPQTVEGSEPTPAADRGG